MTNTQITACGIHADFSRQIDSIDDVLALYKEDAQKAQAFLESVMRGDTVNTSENRPALHTLLRAEKSSNPYFAEVFDERSRMLRFASDVREGVFRGCRNHRITDIINIGIGGSESGVKAVYHALRKPCPSMRLHFLAAADGVLLDRVLSELNPFTTLAVISSKSFTTQETLINAAAVDQWLLENGITAADRARHLVTVSANPKAADEMCLPPENAFKLWPWVGGRFSVWGSVGLPLAIALGTETFREFLHGAADMDAHALHAPATENLPLMTALYARHNRLRHDARSLCVLPYDERLRIFVDWLQQLEMESLCKEGKTPTGQALWGACGNDGQHSFYQWLREGTDNTCIDVIWSELPGHRHAEHHRALLSNAQAQAQALVSRSEGAGFKNALTTMAVDSLSPRRLGSLMALYEHKTALLGSLCRVNPFDQPGVELGKALCRKLLEK